MDAMIAQAAAAYTPPVHVKNVAAQQPNQLGPDGKPLDQKAWAAAQDFEAQFLTSMMQPMFEGIKSDGPFDGGQGEQMFRSLLVDQYGQQMTRAGGVGVSQQIYKEILKLQEAHS